MQTQIHARTKVELQIREQMTDAFWLMQCSKSERSNNKLTRTTTPPNTSHSIFENRFSGGLQKSQQLGNYLCEFSPPAVTTDSFRKDIAKKLPGTEQFFRARCRHRHFNLFAFGLRIQDCQIVVNLVSHNCTFFACISGL